jgi:hypothetical protein
MAPAAAHGNCLDERHVQFGPADETFDPRDEMMQYFIRETPLQGG